MRFACSFSMSAELAEELRHLAVVVRLELLGELRVALGRLELHGVGARHEIGVLPGRLGFRFHSSKVLSRSSTVPCEAGGA